jgi:hypothetical protein
MARPDADATLAALLDQSEVGLVGTTLVRLSIEEQSSDRAVLEPMMMGGDLALSYESQVTIRLALLSVPQRDEMAAVEIRFDDDLLDRRATPADPRPRLRDALREAADQLSSLVADRWPDGPTGSIPDWDLLYNPREMFAYQGTRGASLNDDLAGLDELDRLATSLIYYQYFEPDLDGATLRFFQDAPAGLLVRETAAQDAPGLLAGDYITEANGEAVAGPQSVSRLFLLGQPGQEVDVTVQRHGETLLLSWPVAAP